MDTTDTSNDLPPSSPPNDICSSPILGPTLYESSFYEGDTLVEDATSETVFDNHPQSDSDLGDTHLPQPGSEMSTVEGSSPHLKHNIGRKRSYKGWETRRRNEDARRAAEVETVEDIQREKQEFMGNVLIGLRERNIRFGDFIQHALTTNKSTTVGEWLWNEIFKPPSPMRGILDIFASSNNSQTGRDILFNWALEVVTKKLEGEANKIKKTGVLRVNAKQFNESFLRNFSFESLLDRVRTTCPTLIQLFNTLITTRRQVRETKGDALRNMLKRKDLIATTTAMTLLGERSKRNSYLRHILGLWMFSNGASRQQISISNRLGYSVCYSTIVGRGAKAREDPLESKDTVAPISKRGMGSLYYLSQSMREATRTFAKGGKIRFFYDNVNIDDTAGDQVIGKTSDVQRDGTSATACEIDGVEPDVLSTEHTLKKMLQAPKLKVEDLDLSVRESKDLRIRLQFTVLRIAVQFCDKLHRFRKELKEDAPRTEYMAAQQKTRFYSLPLMEINESSTIGNADVVDTICKELGIDSSDDNEAKTIKFISGDQLLIARLRSVAGARVGNEGDGKALNWVIRLPGLFHYTMTSTMQVLSTHLGQPNRDVTNPASLTAHNNLLQRKHIIGTSLPNYRTSRNLVFVSLYARVLHCLTLVSGRPDIEGYADDTTWDQLKSDALKVVDQFTDTKKVSKLRTQRKRKGPDHGDMVYENAIIFMRDALLLREFVDAIKVGDGGRTATVIKVWANWYRGGGRTKYAQEAMEFAHNVEHVWTADIRETALKNLFVNTTGKESANIAMDMKQEFQNNDLKNGFKAHGGLADFFEWAKLMGPLLDLLREFNTSIIQCLGAKQGTHHAAPDLSTDIRVLMESLREHSVYEEHLGRVFDGHDEIVPDCLSVGRAALTHGRSTPLDEYNTSFAKLQDRRRINPLTGDTVIRQFNDGLEDATRTSLSRMTFVDTDAPQSDCSDSEHELDVGQGDEEELGNNATEGLPENELELDGYDDDRDLKDDDGSDDESAFDSASDDDD